MTTSVQYEYAGFRYLMTHSDNLEAVTAVALAGQHPAASLAKHIRAALDCYRVDLIEGRIKAVCACGGSGRARDGSRCQDCGGNGVGPGGGLHERARTLQEEFKGAGMDGQ